PDINVGSLFTFTPAFDDWLTHWRKRCADENHDRRQLQMLATNPAIIPRNHLVEEVISTAMHDNDLSLFHRLADKLATPFSLGPDDMNYAAPPRPDQIVHQTFCGT
ncbi:MAG: hypothetical protein HOE54_12535, partial [Gammaproteobacteria bacterium]|nr:hypothetical protein [Gammaproteobacteria bacterium]